MFSKFALQAMSAPSYSHFHNRSQTITNSSLCVVLTAFQEPDRVQLRPEQTAFHAAATPPLESAIVGWIN